ncbi:hypothetical protein TVAG_450620 [Trichomonas vaginalis G3]|uniref:Uncharacterized protein n=1 Tax=Trichomonas vaginalis (strain ATCC PRA-98 / G3) TaxID=412133 RepID=A2EV39_TRIV3|nr:hypothetical protein TVAGG3_0946290 [Trichomonas vaginalis G3]EAY03489.1 hypothetical protein TVAG_450620 [Trichomonas vaginalis G3]KAI5486898.1 hypothetical protein TVAGG3_0946290 [Trichomonas vaginalis G3]|eukprot:XP_001315712.1 hypothetical protein [Trichomonas vaginalis G3]
MKNFTYNFAVNPINDYNHITIIAADSYQITQTVFSYRVKQPNTQLFKKYYGSINDRQIFVKPNDYFNFSGIITNCYPGTKFNIILKKENITEDEYIPDYPPEYPPDYPPDYPPEFEPIGQRHLQEIQTLKDEYESHQSFGYVYS